MTQEVDIVVNYYNPDKEDILYYQTLYCIFRYSLERHNLIISDGSGFADGRIAEIAKANNITYLWSDRRLKFAESYNMGIRHSIDKSEALYICLSANDIFAGSDAVQKMLKVMKSDEGIGCVIPYLDNTDYPLQRDSNWKKLRYCNGMTLNLNMFRKDVLEKTGLVPEYLSGYFNDVVMSAKISDLGKKIALCDAGKIIHIGSATIRLSSNASFERDKKEFIRKHPDLAPRNPYLNVKYIALDKGSFIACLYEIINNMRSEKLTKLFFFSQKAWLVIEKYMHITARYCLKRV